MGASHGHWGVENNLRWQMDFTFRDDKNTSMSKTGAKNLQIMKKTLSILGLVKESYKISMKRIRYDLSPDYENGVGKCCKTGTERCLVSKMMLQVC